MVVVQKKSGGVGICVDPKHLNENVLREVYPMPHVDETLSFLAGAKVFSKLDTNSGFGRFPWQTHAADILLHLLRRLDVIGLISFPSGYQAHQNFFKNRLLPFWKDYQESSATWMIYFHLQAVLE